MQASELCLFIELSSPGGVSGLVSFMPFYETYTIQKFWRPHASMQSCSAMKQRFCCLYKPQHLFDWQTISHIMEHPNITLNARWSDLVACHPESFVPNSFNTSLTSKLMLLVLETIYKRLWLLCWKVWKSFFTLDLPLANPQNPCHHSKLLFLPAIRFKSFKMHF